MKKKKQDYMQSTAYLSLSFSVYRLLFIFRWGSMWSLLWLSITKNTMVNYYVTLTTYYYASVNSSCAQANVRPHVMMTPVHGFGIVIKLLIFLKINSAM